MRFRQSPSQATDFWKARLIKLRTVACKRNLGLEEEAMKTENREKERGRLLSLTDSVGGIHPALRLARDSSRASAVGRASVKP